MHHLTELLASTLLFTAVYIRLVNGQASPCPEILSYEPRDPNEPDRWYGVIMLSSEDDLEGIWLKIFLDNRAELIGNWFGDTSSSDNTEFHIKNPQYKLEAGPPVSIRFFVKYNVQGHIPSVKKILLNGKNICSIIKTKPTPPMLHISRPSDREPMGFEVVDPPVSNKNPETDRYDGDRHNDRNEFGVNTGNGHFENNYGGMEHGPHNGDNFKDPSHESNLHSNYDNNDANRRPVGPVSSSSSNSNSHKQTSRPFSGTSTTRTTSTSFHNEDDRRGNGRHTTRPGRSTTTALPDLTNIRDEHGRPVFDTNQHQNRPSTNNYDFDRTKDGGTTQRPTHNSKNQLSINSNTNGNDYIDEHDFFPGDYVNLISRPSTRPQTINSRAKPECGTVAARPNALISHAQNTTPGQWPWHAALYHSKGIQLVYTCGGTLISERHIITAAHCVTRPNSNQKVNVKFLLVYLGKYNLIAFGPEVQDRDVEDIYVHPNYNHTVYFNDIAVLKLGRPVELTNNVRPCCLWEGSINLEDIATQHGTVVGWGFDENKQLSRNLMKAEMPIVNTVKCIYSNREFFSQFTFENNFCAGFRNGTSVCNGDSGGGMVLPKSGTSGNGAVWQLRGIVSVGVALQTQGICDTSHYIIFTDVAKYLPWIKKIVNSNDT